MKLPDECPAHSGIIVALEEVGRRFESGVSRMEHIENDARVWRKDMGAKLDVLTNGLRTRPPWIIVFVITALFGLVCTLITVVAQNREAHDVDDAGRGEVVLGRDGSD